MIQKIMDKLKEHDKIFSEHSDILNSHSKMLHEHGEQLDTIAQVVAEHSDRFDHIEKRLDGHDKQFDILIHTVLDHTDRLNHIEQNMATRSDIRDISDTLDVLVNLAKKNDQEITFMGERVGRIESDVKRMKPLLGLT
ncbi:MAG: hypothetical protein HYV41_02100 [Candidatus Magasanikbacteria bacterium]|nr:hypothetical protein [Candidatus Magasanikbacteria bacterium]